MNKPTWSQVRELCQKFWSSGGGPNPFVRAVRWRRDSGGYDYGVLAAAWGFSTAAIGDIFHLEWPYYALSFSVFLLLFEVGLVPLALAAWNSRRHLEFEGLLIDVATRIKAGEPEEEICKALKISKGQLKRLRAMIDPGPRQ